LQVQRVMTQYRDVRVITFGQIRKMAANRMLI
jgi:hypothetical protein